jgi:hypothetical protein
MTGGTISGQMQITDPATGKPVSQVEIGTSSIITVRYVATGTTGLGNDFAPHGEFAISSGGPQSGEKLEFSEDYLDETGNPPYSAETEWVIQSNRLGTSTFTATLGVANRYVPNGWVSQNWGEESGYALSCASGMTLTLSTQLIVVPAKPGVRAISLLPSKGVSGGTADLKYRIEGTRKPTQERVVLVTLGGKSLKRAASGFGKNPTNGRTSFEIKIPRSMKPGRYVWCVSTHAKGSGWSDYKCAALTVT